MKRGFTLIELITSVSVFLLIMTISLGSILGVFSANRKAQAQRAVMNNLNYAVESMSREMRYGKSYHCDTGGQITSPQNCASGASFVSFLSSENAQIVYRLNNNAIEKSLDGGASYAAVTAPEVVIDGLSFFVLGAGAQNPGLQPKALIRIKGHAGSGVTQSNFVLQTLVSQRSLDS